MATKTKTVESIGGALVRCDTFETVRDNYARHHRTIETVADFKSTLRAGAYAWPGGYALYFITSDGAALSFDAARREFRNIIDSIRSRANDGWRVVGCASTAEDDEPVYCDHTGREIV